MPSKASLPFPAGSLTLTTADYVDPPEPPKEVWVRVASRYSRGSECPRLDTKVTDQDGRMVRGVKSVAFEHDAEGYPLLTLQVYPDAFDYEGPGLASAAD